MALFVLGLAALAAVDGPSFTYETCAQQLTADAETALSYAEQWESLGGGDEALHCRAMALLALDLPEQAAQLVAHLAQKSRSDPGVATRLYIQTAEAWMAAGRKKESYAALREAYGLTPDAPALHMASATIYATGAQWEGVVLALNALERHAPLSADALALRARAKFERSEFDSAGKDVADALALDPLLVDALVLRGRLAEAGHPIPDDPFTSAPD
ncbi:MAG: tetratricopeptide repeat protein [Parvularcula sp.]